MNIGYEGMGAWCATLMGGDIQEGAPVKSTGGDIVAPCADGEEFLGVARTSGGVEELCTVQLGGLVTLPYSGGKVGPGWKALVSDGKGGVKLADTGHAYLVISCNTTQGTITFKL